MDVTKLKDHLIQTRQQYFPELVSGWTITDCKVLAKRRMAFVGFSTVDAAAACVQFLHRSYYRTTQLIVEFALPPKESTSTIASTTVAQDQQHAAPDAETISRHGDLDDGAKTEDESDGPGTTSTRKTSDIKKKEFLELMGGNNTRHTWSNDDGFIDEAKQTPPTTTKEAVNPQQGHNDSLDESSDSDEDDADPVRNSNAVRGGQSDSEFLRSKTVAVHDFDTAENAEENQQNNSSPDALEQDEIIQMKPENWSAEENPEGDDDEEEEEARGSSDDRMNETSGSDSVCLTRLFVRNIAFDTSEDHLKEFFSKFGIVNECHVPVDDQRRGKGFGFVSFDSPENAAAARLALDGTDFQGRLIHILPARRAPSNPQLENTHNLSYKEKQELGRRGKSMDDQSGWSASHLRSEAVVDSLAARLGIQKGAILAVKDGVSGGDAAVRLALAETAIIEENRRYFAEHGIDMEALVSFTTENDDKPKARSQTRLLVKNLPHDTTIEELLKTFGSQGSDPLRILLPPSRTVAVVEFSHAHDAKRAFKRLAYRRFKAVPLYLEWAPVASLGEELSMNADYPVKSMKSMIEIDDGVDQLDESLGPTTTVYVKNLNFRTTEEELRSVFAEYAGDIRTVRIPKKVAPLKRTANEMDGESSSQSLSMGYGFVEFQSRQSATFVVKTLQGKMVAGHSLELQIAKGSAQQQQRKPSKIPIRPPSKIIARNVPFQATRTDLLQLFGTFGHLKKVRLPKKFDGNHRGFAFIEFVSGKEAAAAMAALSRTHLYGRHLVLEWAANKEGDGNSGDESGPTSPQDNNNGLEETTSRPNKKRHEE